MIPIRQASLEFEEFLMANEYDLGNSADTVAFYRKKIKPLLAWAEREGEEGTQRHLKPKRERVTVPEGGDFHRLLSQRKHLRAGPLTTYEARCAARRLARRTLRRHRP